MAISQSTLYRYFERYGWEFQKTDDPNIVITGYEQGESHQALSVALDEMVVAFTCPLANFVYEASKAEQLLRLNFDLPAAKVSLDDEQAVILSVELPADGFGFDAFAFAIEVLMQAADLVRASVTPNKGETPP